MLNQPVIVAGPWKGVNTAKPPYAVERGEVCDGRNVHFHNGRLSSSAPLVAHNTYPRIKVEGIAFKKYSDSWVVVGIEESPSATHPGYTDKPWWTGWREGDVYIDIARSVEWWYNGETFVVITTERGTVLTLPVGYTYLGDPIDDVRFVYSILCRDGTEQLLFICADRLYLGSLASVHDVTPDPQVSPYPGIAGTPWSLPDGKVPTLAQMTTDVYEWFILGNGADSILWRIRTGVMEKFEEFYITRTNEELPLLCGVHMAVFAERLVLGDIQLPDGRMPHGIGWYGVNGPFDRTYPTAGVMPLTDTPGEVTGFFRIQDYLGIMKPTSISLTQKTYLPETPYVVVTRVASIGCSNFRTIQTIQRGTQAAYAQMRDNGVLFLSTDNAVRLFEGEEAQRVDAPVRNIIDAHKDEMLTCWSMYDSRTDLYKLVYSDTILAYHATEHWWTIERRPEGIFCATQRTVVQHAIECDELEGIADGLHGAVDDLPGSITIDTAAVFNEAGSLLPNEDAERTSFTRTQEYRFAKPQTITRAIFRVRTMKGGQLMVRHSIDGGGSWSALIPAGRTDIAGVTKVFYNFVATSEQFVFELYFKGRSLEIEDLTFDLPVSKQQEAVTPLFADYGG